MGNQSKDPRHVRAGRATLERYGVEFLSEIGKVGGQRAKARHGPEFYREIGRKGGRATRDRHGPGYYARIGALGGAEAKRRLDAAIAKLGDEVGDHGRA